MFGIKQLAVLLEEKDFDQVERLFQYYTVLREEAQIFGTNFIQDRAGLGTTSISKDDLNDDECARYDHLESRREALELMITVEEQQRLMELALVLKD